MKTDWPNVTFWGCISLVAGFFLMMACVNGCVPDGQVQSPAQATARSSILLVARAVKVADQTCAQYVRDTKDVSVGEVCVKAYDSARPSLQAAEAGVDAWDDVSKKRMACATLDGVVALKQISHVLSEHKIALPQVVTDALDLVDSFGKGLCS